MVFGTGKGQTKPQGRPAKRVAFAQVGLVHMGRARLKRLRSVLNKIGGFSDLVEELSSARRAQMQNKQNGVKGVQTTELTLMLYSANLVEDEG